MFRFRAQSAEDTKVGMPYFAALSNWMLDWFSDDSVLRVMLTPPLPEEAPDLGDV